MNKIENYIRPEGCSLGLKVVYPDGSTRHSHIWNNQFRWSITPGGWTEAHDWDPTPKSEGGLHVWAWARGNRDASDLWDTMGVLWLAVEYDDRGSVKTGYRETELKVRKAKTVAVSNDRREVINFIRAHTPKEKQGPLIYEEQIVEEGDATVEGYGVAIVRGKGTARVGDYGVAKALGNGGIAVAGSHGRAVVGDGGTATAGYAGTAVAGDGGTASVGTGGSAKAGEGGKLEIMWYKEGNHYTKTLFVGQDGIKPDTFYGLDGDGNPICKDLEMKSVENYTLPEGHGLGLMLALSKGQPEHSTEYTCALEPGGETVFPKWNPKPDCGDGLLIWAWAQGNISDSYSWNRYNVIWMAVEYDESSALPSAGARLKVPKCRTIAVSSDPKEIAEYIRARTPSDKVSMPASLFMDIEVGDDAHLEVGDAGAVRAGQRSTAKAGRGSTVIAGDGGYAQAGEEGTAIVGSRGTAYVGEHGKAKAGEGGTLVFETMLPGIVIKRKVGDGFLKPDTFYTWLSNVVVECPSYSE